MSYSRKVEGPRPARSLSLSKQDLNNMHQNCGNQRIPEESINQKDFLSILEKEYEKVKRKNG